MRTCLRNLAGIKISIWALSAACFLILQDSVSARYAKPLEGPEKVEMKRFRNGAGKISYPDDQSDLLTNRQIEPGKDPLKPHNFLVIITDDLGWSDIGAYGNTFIETPNLDRLANSGVRYTNAYAPASLCSPSRASIVTGLHPVSVNITEHIHGNQPVGPDRKLQTPPVDQALKLSFETTAEVLDGLGYKSAYYGKWHLGGGPNGPGYQGFDTTFAAGANGLPYSFFYPFFNWGIKDIQTVSQQGDYLTNVLTQKAIEYMLTADTAFIMYLNYYAPHVPIEAPDSLVQKYLAKAGGTEEGQIPNPYYAAMVTTIDQNIGKLLDALETASMMQNTTIIFTSDNGGLSVREVPGFDKHTPPTDNFPLREGKGYLYEGGIRVPLILRTPEMHGSPGVVDRPVTGTDIHYTILDLLNVKTDKDQGQSLLYEQQDERALYWHVPHYSPQGGKPASAIRKGNYKLIYFYEDERAELYDVANDPTESTDLSKSNRTLAKQLLDELKRWKFDIGAKDPLENPLYEKK